MDKVQKQRGSIVLHKETRDGADYIRIEYANSQAEPNCSPKTRVWKWLATALHTWHQPLSACRISTTTIHHTPILITAGFTCGIPNLKGNTHCRKATSNCWNRSVTAPRPSKHTVPISATSWNITRDGTSTA